MRNEKKDFLGEEMQQIGYITHKGMVRSHNEDALFILPEHDIYVVADGVGGNAGGEVASRTCVYEITQYVYGNDLPEDADAKEVKEYLKACIDRVNSSILSKANEHEGMATTVVICCIRGGYAYIGHVGDSRAYIARGKNLIQITEDHTYVNALIKAGVITEEEALTHEKRHMITRALGAEETVKADFKQVELKKDDKILLCTDGLFGEVEDDVIKDIITEEGIAMAKASEKLVTAANAAGGGDNITVICLKI